MSTLHRPFKRPIDLGIYINYTWAPALKKLKARPFQFIRKRFRSIDPLIHITISVHFRSSLIVIFRASFRLISKHSKFPIAFSTSTFMHIVWLLCGYCNCDSFCTLPDQLLLQRWFKNFTSSLCNQLQIRLACICQKIHYYFYRDCFHFFFVFYISDWNFFKP